MNDRSSIENIPLHQGKRPLVLMFAMALVLTALPGTTLAEIQLDGNATKAACTGTSCTDTDWDEINLGNGGGAIARTGLIVDRPEPGFNQFSGGGSKDEQDITSWKHRGNSPPSKDDLSHAYAAAFSKNVGGTNHTILAFGMDRYDTSGDAQLGFWFLGSNVQPVAGGDFESAPGVPAQHQDGDLLILVNFSNGGTVPTIQVFRWAGGAIVPQGAGAQVLCTNGAIPTNTGATFCGITNPDSVASPWDYEAKGAPGVDSPFPSGAFFEGAIDLTASGLDTCFTGFIAESRSSTSITAVLKDFAIPTGGFNLCAIEVLKSCPGFGVLNAAQNAITYTITGTITNTGAATLYNVSLSDNPNADPAGPSEHFDVVDCATKTIDQGDFPVTSLATGAAAAVCFKATLTGPLTSQQTTDTVTVTSNSQSDGNGTSVTDTGQAICSPPTIPAALSVTKACTTEIADTGSALVVKVNVTGQICNNGGAGSSNLSQVTLVDSIIGSVTLSGTTLLADTDPSTPGNQGQCRAYGFTYQPDHTNSTVPGSICFQDTVTANAKDIFGGSVTPMTATADCSLCPGGVCPPAP